MIRVLKRFQKINFLFLLGILSSKLAVAHSEPNTDICDLSLCKNSESFELSATLLYLKPNIDDSHYVLSSFANTFDGSLFPDGKRHQNVTSFSPGFSFEGLYGLSPNISCLDFRFTYFKDCSANCVSGNFLYDTNGFPGFGAQAIPVYAGTAKSKNFYNFYAGDITYNRTFMDFFSDNLKFIFGLHVAYIKFKEHTTSTGTFINNQIVRPLLNNLNRNSRFCGIGPQIGLDYQFFFTNLSHLLGTWTFRANTRGSLLCGNLKSNLRYVTLRTGPGGVGFRNGELWRIIPSASTEFGINYTLNCKCFLMTVELGYKLGWYSQCVNKITGLDVAFAGNTIDVFNSFSLNGPFLRLNSSF